MRFNVIMLIQVNSATSQFIHVCVSSVLNVLSVCLNYSHKTELVIRQAINSAV